MKSKKEMKVGLTAKQRREILKAGKTIDSYYNLMMVVGATAELLRLMKKAGMFDEQE